MSDRKWSLFIAGKGVASLSQLTSEIRRPHSTHHVSLTTRTIVISIVPPRPKENTVFNRMFCHSAAETLYNLCYYAGDTFVGHSVGEYYSFKTTNIISTILTDIQSWFWLICSSNTPRWKKNASKDFVHLLGRNDYRCKVWWLMWWFS